METLNITLDLAAIRMVFETYGFYNVTKEEIETVICACLTQYIKDGWASEVLVAEMRQLRSNPEAYKKDADIA